VPAAKLSIKLQIKTKMNSNGFVESTSSYFNNKSLFKVEVCLDNGGKEIKTPYQGKKRCFGEFKCQACGKEWKSANSRANETQTCTRCYMQVLPIRQKSLQSLYEVLRREKSSKQSLIEKYIAFNSSSNNSSIRQ